MLAPDVPERSLERPAAARMAGLAGRVRDRWLLSAKDRSSASGLLKDTDGTAKGCCEPASCNATNVRLEACGFGPSVCEARKR